ncbi:MAG: hypothetical protein H6515_14805 [Microthrixaceae bacterium]|jgi:hypothetical protein|nr:hypothetical protein [Microthrixaceae bacterium]
MNDTLIPIEEAEGLAWMIHWHCGEDARVEPTYAWSTTEACATCGVISDTAVIFDGFIDAERRTCAGCLD